MQYEVTYPNSPKSEIISEHDYYNARIECPEMRVLKSIPENIEDEDYLAGWAYPAHECWND